MKTAKPLLLVLTPIGLVSGLHEAWRLGGAGLAFLMIVMMGGLAVAFGTVLVTIRREQRSHGERS
jgi:hypothetical protein